MENNPLYLVIQTKFNMKYDQQEKTNIPEFGVSELAMSLKRTLEDSYGRVRVRGELGRVNIHSSGHMYSSIKDDKSCIDAVCWKGNVGRLSVKPEEGLEVICTGKITSYPARSNYQIVIDKMELAGEGALLKLLEERKKRLAAEGLFNDEYKSDIPFLPERIGVITSPTGAVIRDIIHRISERFPRPVLLYPVRVQGETAADEITDAVKKIDALPDHIKPDLLIIARGGGSVEDLMPFNEENVVRAVFDCSIPVISAVGHETDTTLIDYVADLRAPTPTGAAEKAVPRRIDVLYTINGFEETAFSAIRRKLSDLQVGLENRLLRMGDPHSMLENRIQTLDYLSGNLRHHVSSLCKDRFLRVRSIHVPTPDILLERKRSELSGVSHRIGNSFQRHVSLKLNSAAGLFSSIKAPAQRLREATGMLDMRGDMLDGSLLRYIKVSSAKLEYIGNMLNSLSYENVLKRGFAVVRDSQGNVVSSTSGINHDDVLEIQFKDMNKLNVKAMK